MWKYIATIPTAIIAIVTIWNVQPGDAVCNVCKNGFACVSETEFQLCFGDERNANVTYSCPNPNEICTQYARVCMPRNALPDVAPACAGIKNCVCDEVLDYMFVCTSRTTFTMCYNATYTTTRGICPDGQLCDVQRAGNGDSPCTNECVADVADSSLCDFDEAVDLPSTTTPATTTTPPSSSTSSTSSTDAPTTIGTTTTEPVTTTTVDPQAQALEICAEKKSGGRFVRPDDTTCTKYIFCYWNLTGYTGINQTCPIGSYFNRNSVNCQTEKPSWCP